MWPSLRRTCHHSLIISHINIAPTVSYIDIVLSFEKNIFCVKWDKMKCVAPSVSSHRRISISPARNCFNIQELPEFQECKRKTTAAGQIWKNNRVLSSFHKHFHSDSIQELLLIDLEAEVLFTVFRQGREDSIAVSVFVDISIEFDKSDGKLQINTLILSDEEPCLSPVCVSALSSLLNTFCNLGARRLFKHCFFNS